MQVEKGLRDEKMVSVNFASHQVNRKACKEKDVPKANGKKILVVVALGETINKVVKYFFYKRKNI